LFCRFVLSVCWSWPLLPLSPFFLFSVCISQGNNQPNRSFHPSIISLSFFLISLLTLFSRRSCSCALGRIANGYISQFKTNNLGPVSCAPYTMLLLSRSLTSVSKWRTLFLSSGWNASKSSTLRAPTSKPLPKSVQ
jgi:hypothetical protein